MLQQRLQSGKIHALNERPKCYTPRNVSEASAKVKPKRTAEKLQGLHYLYKLCDLAERSRHRFVSKAFVRQKLPSEEVKRPGHEVDPADGADVRGPHERVAALELLDL